MMRKIANVIVAVDFSPTSEVALEYALALAGPLGATMHLLHVVESSLLVGPVAPEVYIGAAAPDRDTLIDEAAYRLARLVPSPQRERLHITSEVRVGWAAATICDVAAARHTDLIVMGTHGRTGLAHLLVGSVAEKVMRQAPCPVLTVRSHGGAAVAPAREVSGEALVPTLEG